MAYFGAPGLPKDLVDIPVERVADAVGYLARRRDVRANKIAIGIVPSPLVEPGLRYGKGPVNEPAWTYDGKPIPFATYPEIEALLHSGDIRPVRDALIDFVKINGPVAIIAGGDDTLGFSGALFSRALPYLHLARTDVFENFPGAGHLIDAPYTPTANLERLQTPYGVLRFGGTPSAYAEADARSWKTIIELLNRWSGASVGAAPAHFDAPSSSRFKERHPHTSYGP